VITGQFSIHPGAGRIILFFKDPVFRQRIMPDMEAVSQEMNWKNIAKKTGQTT